MKTSKLLAKAIKDFYGEGRPEKEIPMEVRVNMKDETYVKSLRNGRQRLKIASGRT